MPENDYDLEQNEFQSVNSKTWQDSSSSGGTGDGNKNTNDNVPLSLESENISQLSKNEQETLEEKRNDPEFQKGLNKILPSGDGNDDDDKPKNVELSQLIKDWQNENKESKEDTSQEKQKENKTGLPDQLKTRMESLSGISLDDVNVYYNSSLPAEYDALAYAQGVDIYIASGEEKHLPHELWHVVQQKQGSVQATGEVKGQPLNESSKLEKEATALGDKAMKGEGKELPEDITSKVSTNAPIQRTLVYSYLSNSIIENMNNSPSYYEELGFVTATSANGKRVWVDPRNLLEVPSLIAPEETLKEGTLATESSPEAVDNVKNYLIAQVKYQNLLNQKFTESEIMENHKSVGFEYEFANYTNGNADVKELQSHIVLGESGKFSKLFPLKFELETDSGKVLEIGMPPLLVSNKDGSPDKAGIKAVYEKLRATMKSIREATQDKDMKTLIEKLEEVGLGVAWKETGEVEKYPNLKISDSQGRANKFENSTDNIYSQMNISMTAEESAEIIKIMMEDDKKLQEEEDQGARGTAEKGILGKVSQELANLLEPLAKTNEAGSIAAIHINKALTNILAIPAIRGWHEGISTEEEYDLDSIVKELYGVWVKDSLPNILKTSVSMTNPIEFVRLVKDVKEYMMTEIEKAYESLIKANGIEPPNKLIALRKLKEENAKIDGGLQYVLGKDSEIEEVLKGDESTFLADLKKKIDLMNIELKKEEKWEEEDDYDWTSFYKEEAFAIELVIAKLAIEENLFRQEALEKPNRIKENMITELNVTLENIEKRVIPQTPKIQYGVDEETFGTGVGVRKDTFVESKGGVNVAELRSAYVINKYLTQKEEEEE